MYTPFSTPSLHFLRYECSLILPFVLMCYCEFAELGFLLLLSEYLDWTFPPKIKKIMINGLIYLWIWFSCTYMNWAFYKKKNRPFMENLTAFTFITKNLITNSQEKFLQHKTILFYFPFHFSLYFFLKSSLIFNYL